MDADRLTPFLHRRHGKMKPRWWSCSSAPFPLRAFGPVHPSPAPPVTVKCDGKMLPLTQERMLPPPTPPA